MVAFRPPIVSESTPSVSGITLEVPIVGVWHCACSSRGTDSVTLEEGEIYETDKQYCSISARFGSSSARIDERGHINVATGRVRTGSSKVDSYREPQHTALWSHRDSVA